MSNVTKSEQFRYLGWNGEGEIGDVLVQIKELKLDK